MSAAGHPGAVPPSSDAAERLCEAEFVRLRATPDGDALAAAALIADALEGPFRVRVASGLADESADRDADALAVSCGTPGGDVALTGLASPSAHAVAEELGGGDPWLALAGVVAGGGAPGGHAALRESAGLECAPGVGVPTDDAADGLAHSTLVHAGFSGDREAAARALAGVERDGRTLASLVALSAVRGAPGTAATAVERALRPHRGGPLHTIEGLADVLDAAARERPGAGLAFALGGASAPALEAWREHARRVHPPVRNDPTRYDGLAVVETAGRPARLVTVARLVRDYRTPEPVAAAVGDGGGAVAADRDVETAVRAAAEAVGCRVAVRGHTARVGDDAEAFVAALRREL